MSANKNLTALAEAYRLQSTGTAVFDIVNGCPVTVAAANQALTLSFPMEQGAFEGMKEGLTEQLKNAGAGRPSWRQGMVYASIKKPKLICEQYGALKQIIASMAAPYLRASVCPYCGGTDCDAAAVRAGLYRPVHRRCYESDYAGEREKISLGSGSYITGAVGALLGALVMLAASFLLILLTKRVYGWLFVLMPMAALFGYKKLNGPYGGGGIAIISACSALMFLLYLYCEIIRQICEALSITVSDCLASLGEVSSMLFTGWFLGSCWFEILFFAIGLVLVIVTRPLSKTKQMGDLDALRAFTRPLNSAYGDYAQPQAPASSWNPDRPE